MRNAKREYRRIRSGIAFIWMSLKWLEKDWDLTDKPEHEKLTSFQKHQNKV